MKVVLILLSLFLKPDSFFLKCLSVFLKTTTKFLKALFLLNKPSKVLSKPVRDLGLSFSAGFPPSLVFVEPLSIFLISIFLFIKPIAAFHELMDGFLNRSFKFLYTLLE